MKKIEDPKRSKIKTDSRVEPCHILVSNMYFNQIIYHTLSKIEKLYLKKMLSQVDCNTTRKKDFVLFLNCNYIQIFIMGQV